jgi:NADH-quinone oxidoreductase subunit C
MDTHTDDTLTPPETVEVSPALKTVFMKLEERFGVRLLESTVFRGELTFRVGLEDWIEVLTFCRDTPDLAFDRLDCLVGNHFPARTDAPFELIAHLTNVATATRLRVKVRLAEEQPAPTAVGVWPSAGWDEREIYEMFGVVFEGHPDLRRLLTLPDFDGFPLRKDFPTEGKIGGRIRTDLKGQL